MRALPLGLVLLALAASGAAAALDPPSVRGALGCRSAPMLHACAGDWGTTGEACDERGAQGSGTSGVRLVAYVVHVGVEGRDSCASAPHDQWLRTRSLTVTAGDGWLRDGASVTWYAHEGGMYETGPGCYVHVHYHAVGSLVRQDETHGCPAGQAPPDAPWGRLLP